MNILLGLINANYITRGQGMHKLQFRILDKGRCHKQLIRLALLFDDKPLRDIYYRTVLLQYINFAANVNG